MNTQQVRELRAKWEERIAELESEIKEIEAKLEQSGWSDRARRNLTGDIDYRKGKREAYHQAILDILKI